ncbi:MAG: hypothetical protein EXR71_20870 [Myxococcales bacterium]|nr:hypothetical protein [Myxococcales bacterium]
MFLPLFALAVAHDPADAPPPSEPPVRPEWHLEASSQLMPDTLTLDLRARADGKRDGYVLAAMRIDASGRWLGRAGVGFDLFGGGRTVDLKLGVFLGGVGDLDDRSMVGRPTLGGEVLFGLRFGRVYGHIRHLDGFVGPLEARLTEDELRVGFQVAEHVGVHGQLVAVNPGTEIWTGGAGVGVEVAF